MPSSDLYKTGRLVNAEDFVTRVSAAMIQHAAANVQSLAGNARNLAIFTLLNPMAPEPSMVALAASDGVVLGQVTLDGPVAGLEALADAEVKRVVSAKWGTVATKYPKDPTPTAAP